MPFTFAHPAIVIPLSQSRLRLSLTALVAGSMVPDFEYFFRMKAVKNIGHHGLGLFVFDFPVAIVLTFIFHRWVRNPLIEHLPVNYRLRFDQYLGFDWNLYVANHLGRVAISLFIGILSHFAWDAFTHHDGFFVLLVPALSHQIVLGPEVIPVYLLLQIVSSLWGLWMIYRMIAVSPRRPGASYQSSQHFTYWSAWLMVASIILTARLVWQPEYRTFWDVFFSVLGSLTYALIFNSVLYTEVKQFKWKVQSLWQ